MNEDIYIFRAHDPFGTTWACCTKSRGEFCSFSYEGFTFDEASERAKGRLKEKFGDECSEVKFGGQHVGLEDPIIK